MAVHVRMVAIANVVTGLLAPALDALGTVLGAFSAEEFLGSHAAGGGDRQSDGDGADGLKKRHCPTTMQQFCLLNTEIIEIHTTLRVIDLLLRTTLHQLLYYSHISSI